MKEKITKKNILFTCNKCKRFVVKYIMITNKISFGSIKDAIETECKICNKETTYTLGFELETESDYTK